MEKMTPKQIAETGPDGTTPVMQLFANVTKKQEDGSEIENCIIQFTMSRFLLKNVLEGSIIFWNINIFQKLFKRRVSKSDATNLAKTANG